MAHACWGRDLCRIRHKRRTSDRNARRFAASRFTRPTTRARANHLHDTLWAFFATLALEVDNHLRTLDLAMHWLSEFSQLRRAFMHLHVCSQCLAVITIDEGHKCRKHCDHEEGLCEACALPQPGSDDIA
jgi:hypothetical protein